MYIIKNLRRLFLFWWGIIIAIAISSLLNEHLVPRVQKSDFDRAVRYSAQNVGESARSILVNSNSSFDSTNTSSFSLLLKEGITKELVKKLVNRYNFDRTYGIKPNEDQLRNKFKYIIKNDVFSGSTNDRNLAEFRPDMANIDKMTTIITMRFSSMVKKFESSNVLYRILLGFLIVLFITKDVLYYDYALSEIESHDEGSPVVLFSLTMLIPLFQVLLCLDINNIFTFLFWILSIYLVIDIFYIKNFKKYGFLDFFCSREKLDNYSAWIVLDISGIFILLMITQVYLETNILFPDTTSNLIEYEGKREFWKGSIFAVLCLLFGYIATFAFESGSSDLLSKWKNYLFIMISIPILMVVIFYTI